MVKSKPRLPNRASRKQSRLLEKLNSHHRHLLKLASFSSSPKILTKTPQIPSQKPDKSPVTPSSLSMRRRIKFMKRAKSLSSSISCSSSSSSPKITLSPLTFTPEKTPLPPLPPHPSPELLRRTVSDTSMLVSRLSGDNNFTPKRSPSSSSSRPVSRNLMGQLTPLPSSSPSLSNVLRRTISDPVYLQSPTSKEEKVEKEKTEAKAVEAEKLSGEWIVVKFNCECGKDGHYLVNAADKKYFKLT